MIGQQLKRYHAQDRREAVDGFWDGDRLIGEAGDLLFTLGDDGKYASTTRLNLLYIRHDLLIHRVTWRDTDHRHHFIDECDGPVLHLGGGVTLCMNVRDLLELQRPFQRNGKVVPTPEEQRVLRQRVRVRELFNFFAVP